MRRSTSDCLAWYSIVMVDSIVQKMVCAMWLFRVEFIIRMCRCLDLGVWVCFGYTVYIL